MPRDTTIVYSEAKKLMQQLANQDQKDIYYRLNTSDTKMIEWANSAGAEIFDWFDTHYEDDVFVATSCIVFEPDTE